MPIRYSSGVGAERVGLGLGEMLFIIGMKFYFLVFIDV